jgi:Protein of unknown function (DUF3592)
MKATRIPDALRRSPPRPVRLNAGGMFVAGVALALLAGGVIGGAWLYAVFTRDQDRASLIDREGIPTEGEVVEIRRVGGEQPRRVATYRYEAGGESFTGHTNLRRSDWQRVQVGSRVPIRYLPSNPKLSWVRGHEPKGAPIWIGPVVAVSLALSAGLIFQQFRKQRSLLAEGRVALGRVMEAKRFRRSTGHGSHTGYRVRYEFQVLSGATCTGSYEVSKNPPAPGTPVTVIYDREEPKRNARYPFQLVRVSD